MLKTVFLNADLSSKILSMISDIRILVSYSSRILKRNAALICRAVSFKAVSFPLGLAMIYITKTTLDKGLLAKDLNVFIKLSFAGLGIFLVTRVLEYLNSRALLEARSVFSKEVTRDMTKRMLDLDYLKLKSLSSSENSFLLGYDHHVVEGLIFDDIPSIVTLVKVPVFFFLAALMSFPLTLLVFLAFPLVALNTVIVASRKRKYRARELYATRKYDAFLHDILLNIKLIKSFFKESWFLGKLSGLFDVKTEAMKRSISFSYKVNFFSNSIVKINTVIFWLAGGYFVISGSLSFGSFTAVAMYMALIVSEVQNVGSFIQDINEEGPAIKRSARFIKDMSVSEGGECADIRRHKMSLSGDIVFENVSFGYKDKELLLKGLRFTIPGGKWTLVKGESGAGKTTLLCLLMRLFTPSEGRILIAGEDVGCLDKGVLSDNIAVVHQEPYMLDDTIINNILLGEDKDPGEIDRVLVASKLDKLVGGLPLGYNTRVGESGAVLSGGERQRVAIARAIVRKPRVLLMDEATSSVDPDTEGSIFANVRDMLPETTVIYVTHRPGVSGSVDEEFLLENGTIVHVERKEQVF